MAAPAPQGMKLPPQLANLMKASKKAGVIDKMVNLNPVIKTLRVLNRSDEDSTISDSNFALNPKPNSSEYIVSDADEELLILVEFKENVALESVSLFAVMENKEADVAWDSPKRVFLYKVDSLNKDFDDALAMKPDVKVMCEAPKLRSKKGHVVNIKKKSAKASIAFGKLDKLMIYIASNQSDAEQTFLSALRFEGASSEKTDMSRWNDVKCKS